MLNRIVSVALLVLFTGVVGVFAPDHAGLDEGPWPVRTISAGVETLALWSLAHPQAFLLVAVAVAVPFLLAALAAKLPRRVTKDPQRLFSAAQRRQGSQLAGGRCEMESLWWVRCRRPAQHGDHWFPHSLGGATTMGNYVAACAPCNLSKSNKIPTWFETTRLERRRRRYFPPGTPVTTGAKTQLPSAAYR